MKPLEGQALSDHNATQNAIQSLCVRERKCWKEDPGTCPSAQTESNRNICTLYQEPAEKPKENVDTVYLYCDRYKEKKPLSYCCKCFKHSTCQKFEDYIKEQAK